MSPLCRLLRRRFPVAVAASAFVAPLGITPASVTAAEYTAIVAPAQTPEVWKPFTPKNKMFTVLLPGKPEENTETIGEIAGTNHLFLAGIPKQYGYGVGYMEVGEKMYAQLRTELKTEDAVQKMLLDKFLEGFLEEGSFKGAKPVPVKMGNRRAYDVITKNPEDIAYGQVRVFVDGRRVAYLMILQGKNHVSPPSRAKFIDSFRWTPEKAVSGAAEEILKEAVPETPPPAKPDEKPEKP